MWAPIALSDTAEDLAVAIFIAMEKIPEQVAEQLPTSFKGKMGALKVWEHRGGEHVK